MITDAFKVQNLANDVKSAGENVMVGHKSAWECLVEGVLWNSSARIEKDPETGDWVTKGNVTEQGLIKFFMKIFGAEGSNQKRAELLEENILTIISFTSSRKRASIVVRNPSMEGTDQEVRVYCKGAPDMLFDFTSSVVVEDGSVQSLNGNAYVPEELLNGDEQGTQDTYKGLFERTVKKFARQAYRTLLITYKDMSMADYESLKAQNNNFQKEGDRIVLEQDLTAVGIFGLQDPLRPSIKTSIEQCRKAGITVIMCTGDNIDTAVAISKNAGIVTEEQCKHPYSCMTGKDFRETVGTIQTKMVDGKEVDYVPNMKKFKEVK